MSYLAGPPHYSEPNQLQQCSTPWEIVKRTGGQQRAPIDLYGVRIQYMGISTTGYNVAWMYIYISQVHVYP